MKIKYFYTLLVISMQLLNLNNSIAQDIEEVNNTKFNSVVAFLNDAKIEKDDYAITMVKEIIGICPALDSPVKSYESYKNEVQKKIDDKSGEMKSIDHSIPQIRISGVVESKEKGYAIINSNGSYYAVKTDQNVGNSFSGSIVKSEGTITYKPLGGNTYSVQKYTQGSGETPQEKYSSATKDLASLNKQYAEQWNIFRTNCINLLNKEIQSNNKILIERHYEKGEKFLNEKDYEQAYDEFIYIQKIDPNYLDIKQKVDISNNKNSRVKRASVFSIKGIGLDHYLIGTSSGIYESVDGGKTWKINSYEGKQIDKFDACEDVMIANTPDMGIMFGKINNNGMDEWSKNVIKYSVAYAKTKTPDGKDHYNREYQIIYPDFPVRLLKIIPYGNRYISFVAFDIKAGIMEKGKKQFVVQENTVWGQYYIEDAGERLRIAETCLTPDFGKNWVAYWGTLIGSDDYFSPLKDRNEVLDMIERTEEYFEISEDAVDIVKEYISQKKGISESEINIVATSDLNNEDIEDEDIILVLTNNGLYRSCYDCEKVEEIILPSDYAKPISLFYDNKQPNVILLGLQGQGVIISRDSGVTWEEI